MFDEMRQLIVKFTLEKNADVRIIGLRHCVEFNYGNNATSAANFIIVIMTRTKRLLLFQ